MFICSMGGREKEVNFGKAMITTTSRMCLASNVNTHQLRFQLDQLHKEASETASKANNARLRLLRLSEAAEKLRQQAAKSLRVGKDDEARDLLFQKKKILRAMEISKNRAHLLDELASKLTEAISVKETNLVGKVASDYEFGRDELNSAVHVVSPKQDNAEVVDDNDKFTQSNAAVCEVSDSDLDREDSDSVGTDNVSNWIESEIPSRLDGISSYNRFLEHLDSQFSNIETDLNLYLRLISMVLEDKEMTTNVKLQQVKEILHKVHDSRSSIQKVLKSEK